MAAGSLDSAEWWVLDYEGNPVPGDPEATASLAVQLLTHSRQAQDHGSQLSQVHSANAGTMVGDYAESFTSVLASLPRAANGLSNVYEACGRALDSFADALGSVQTQAASCLQQATQADSDYRSAAASVIDMLPGASWPGLDSPGPIYRGFNGAEAGSLADDDAEVLGEAYGEVRAICVENGGQAEAAEAVRQAAVERFRAVCEDYQTAVRQCVSAIQAAAPDMPYPAQVVAKLT